MGNAPLAALWDLRHRGHVASAREEYRRYSSRHAVPLAASLPEQYARLLASSHTCQDAIEFLLLEVSFLRHRQEQVASDRRLDEIARLLEEADREPDFQFEFQAGLNALCRADHPAALRHFATAARKKRDEREYCYATLNAVLCRETLGYEYKAALKALERRFRPYEKQAWALPMVEQLQALGARSAYREGNLERLVVKMSGSLRGAQLSYFLLWLAELPLLSLPLPESEKAAHVHYLCEKDDGYLVAYRLRTLKGLLVEEDLRKETRATAEIERLYLWTWLWLVTPEESLLDKLLRVRQSVARSLGGHLTPKDFFLLECALRWQGLLLGLEDRTLKHSLAAVTYPSQGRVPLVEYERGLLDYLFALRDGAETAREAGYTRLRASPLHHAPAFRLPSLLEALHAGAPCPSGFRVLVESLREMAAPPPRLEEGILVTLVSHQIALFQNGRKTSEIRSPALASLLHCVQKKQVAHLSQVLESCFRFTEYDPVAHDPRLASLLSRANRLLAAFARFSRKNGLIFAEFRSGSLQIHQASPHSAQLCQQSAAYELLPRNAAGIPSASARPEPAAVRLGEGWLTRHDFERYLSISRSTALRQLSAWRGEGLVSIQGNGKALRYRPSRELVRRLESIRRSPE